MSTAILFENVSKQYRLGEVGTGALSHDLHRTWAKLRGKADPFATVGALNDRESTEKETSDYTWALKDISLDVQQGEILGIIGRNGAGKSTLLKLLSRVTAPTTGCIKAKGRIASLLEVGTGFHPELTGRENIYLNGAILGMRRHEITKQLDEIVEFSGCVKYIDTPVKRYSSGMMVRLGFAVAAHLQCEILVVDEVLAVGDAEFQKKCIGRMKDVASGGRTILFVSHNQQAIRTLTSKVIILEFGCLKFEGTTLDGLIQYKKNIFGSERIGCSYKAEHNTAAPHVCHASVTTSEPTAHTCGDDIAFEFEIANEQAYNDGLRFSFQVCDESNRPLCHFWLSKENSHLLWNVGRHRLRCRVPSFGLYMGKYTLTTWLTDRSTDSLLEKLTEICAFEVDMGDRQRDEFPWRSGDMQFLVDSEWDILNGDSWEHK
ncbi:MAG: ABC transporter ATP-binding protein [Novipirellula sp. JB048]